MQCILLPLVSSPLLFSSCLCQRLCKPLSYTRHFRFVLWPTEFSQDHLCRHGIGTMHGTLEGPPVGVQLKTMTLRLPEFIISQSQQGEIGLHETTAIHIGLLSWPVLYRPEATPIYIWLLTWPMSSSSNGKIRKVSKTCSILGSLEPPLTAAHVEVSHTW